MKMNTTLGKSWNMPTVVRGFTLGSLLQCSSVKCYQVSFSGGGYTKVVYVHLEDGKKGQHIDKTASKLKNLMDSRKIFLCDVYSSLRGLRLFLGPICQRFGDI